jgi:hypothetical protein
VRHFVRLLAIAFLLFLVGCASPKVVVKDVLGNPIPEVLIYSVSLSIDVGPAKTDARGEARVPSNIQGTHWVDVSKPGYSSVRVEVPSSWPLTITLEEL